MQCVDKNWTHPWDKADDDFWRHDRKVLCYYADGAENLIDISSEPPKRCPYQLEQAVMKDA